MNEQENQQLKNLHFKVGELSGRVNQLDKNIDIRFAGIEERLDIIIQNHNGRLNKIEEDCAQMKGKVAGIGMLGGLIGAVIGFLASFFKR